MQKKFWFVLSLVVLLTAACSSAPVEVTRVVEVARDVEVTRLIEVTREVPVVEEVEVTRLVEVVQEVEVTRVVEVEVTAVPTETPTPAPTNTPAPVAAQPASPPTAAPADIESTLLTTTQNTRATMQSYIDMIDQATRDGYINCVDVVNTYIQVATSPTYDVSGSGATVQNAYGLYRTSLDEFTTGAWDMTENCRKFLENPDESGGIGPHQWTTTRVNVDGAINTVVQAIRLLGGD